MQVVSYPDSDYPARKHDHLWLLVGGGPDYHDRATAYYLGNDRDIEDGDIAIENLHKVVRNHNLDLKEAEESLQWYRDSIPKSKSS